MSKISLSELVKKGVFLTLRYIIVLFLLMTILTQAFFTLVRRHLMSFVLLTVWHKA
ncbi:MAG: hypothetical protein IJS73_02485 [Paludibacteraceae bacterium]|nr:hypothetical protein [Paludibacteraceae bacterium]